MNDSAANSPAATVPATSAWVVTFGCLCLSAGHGIAMALVVKRGKLLPSLADFGDAEMKALMLWFLFAIPLALFAYLLRGAFVRLAPGTQRLLSSGVFAATLIAFLRYALVIARG